MNQPAHPSAIKKPLPPALLNALRAVAAERVVTSDAVRAHHGKDLTWNSASLPDAVIWPETTAEVQEIVRIAAPARLPWVAIDAA